MICLKMHYLPIPFFGIQAWSHAQAIRSRECLKRGLALLRPRSGLCNNYSPGSRSLIEVECPFSIDNKFLKIGIVAST
jgi:hypothetical protein